MNKELAHLVLSIIGILIILVGILTLIFKPYVKWEMMIILIIFQMVAAFIGIKTIIKK